MHSEREARRAGIDGALALVDSALAHAGAKYDVESRWAGQRVERSREARPSHRLAELVLVERADGHDDTAEDPGTRICGGRGGDKADPDACVGVVEAELVAA